MTVYMGQWGRFILSHFVKVDTKWDRMKRPHCPTILHQKPLAVPTSLCYTFICCLLTIHVAGFLGPVPALFVLPDYKALVKPVNAGGRKEWRAAED